MNSSKYTYQGVGFVASIAYKYTTQNQSCSEDYTHTPFCDMNTTGRDNYIRIYCHHFSTLGYQIYSTSHIYWTTSSYNTPTGCGCVFLDSTGQCQCLPDLLPSHDFRQYVSLDIWQSFLVMWARVDQELAVGTVIMAFYGLL